MKKKIISLKEFLKRKNVWRKKIYVNKKIKGLKKKLYIETDKLNYSYTHTWLGEPILQTPEDIVTQQEILFKTKPDVIIETGVCWGGINFILQYDVENFADKKNHWHRYFHTK